jgi:hypothetical protein
MIHDDVSETSELFIEFISIKSMERSSRIRLLHNTVKTDSADAQELDNLRRQALLHQGTVKTLRDEIQALEEKFQEQKAAMQYCPDQSQRSDNL